MRRERPAAWIIAAVMIGVAVVVQPTTISWSVRIEGRRSSVPL